MNAMQFSKRGTKIAARFAITILALLLAFTFSLAFGAESVLPDFFCDAADTDFAKTIIFDIRLPRALLALVTGIMLASSGAVFQMFFRNELSDPGLLGISSGATLAAVVSTFLPLSAVTGTGVLLSVSFLNIAAFFGALVSGVILLAIFSALKNRFDSVVLILLGSALGTFYSSVTSILLLSKQAELYSFYSWILGTFNGRTSAELKFVVPPAALSLAAMIFIAPALDVLNGGEEAAQGLGVNIKRLRIIVLISGSIAVSVAVTCGGTISFVALVAPHIARKIFAQNGSAPKARTLIFSSALIGAVLLLFSDTVARLLIRPAEIPCGVVTSFFGVPFFIAIILRSRSSGGKNAN